MVTVSLSIVTGEWGGFRVMSLAIIVGQSFENFKRFGKKTYEHLSI